MFKQGDIILVPFPFSDLSGSKLRPALVVSSKAVNQTRDLICLQITSRTFNDSFFLKLNRSDVSPPLLLESGIRLHKFFTVEQARVAKHLGAVTPSVLAVVLKEVDNKVLCP